LNATGAGWGVSVVTKFLTLFLLSTTWWFGIWVQIPSCDWGECKTA